MNVPNQQPSGRVIISSAPTTGGGPDTVTLQINGKDGKEICRFYCSAPLFDRIATAAAKTEGGFFALFAQAMSALYEQMAKEAKQNPKEFIKAVDRQQRKTGKQFNIFEEAFGAWLDRGLATEATEQEAAKRIS